MIPRDIWPNTGPRVFFSFCQLLLLLAVIPVKTQSPIDFISPIGHDPIIINDTDAFNVGNLNLEEVMVELRRMKRDIRRSRFIQNPG